MSPASHVSPSPPISETLSTSTAPTTRSLDQVLSNTSRRAATFEMQIKALEEKLAEDLSNCRAIESSLKEAFNSIKRNYRRADKDALRTHVPQIDTELDQALGVLDELEMRLPAIRTQAAHVCHLYDSSRGKARLLVDDLRWLNRDFTSRWRAVVFSRSSPVSWRWRATLRALFALAFILVTWAMWIALLGVYRAHRQRLVWGERLIS
ncbi:hypothetical protein B0F90DRAFT_1776905 [Multifurca ochricompacta]|uniref:Uncharacterized protein n=1 Tax=Multifurca ochricompacta TaxID=376703 RepID=A0AAD4LVV3_9AGAM|nr:hypothetical protein B0F90DRAFT_1776905 [Multifurca ochricompacta]